MKPSVFSIQLFSFFLNPYIDKGFENPEERDWLFCNVFFIIILYYIIYIYIYSNYSAPPMGMSNRLTVVLQQELH